MFFASTQDDTVTWTQCDTINHCVTPVLDMSNCTKFSGSLAVHCFTKFSCSVLSID